MNYIVFDLEWNQSPDGKKYTNSRIPFEIIEIGAVKLNKKREIVDQFHTLIKPQVYHWIHENIHEVIHVDYKELENGMLFPQAVTAFLKWCGEKPSFFTWGTQDLTELQRNMRYYDLLSLLPGPITYYNVQKLASICFEDGLTRRALEYTVDQLKIEKGQDFHRALADAYYTAEIVRRMDVESILNNSSIDVFQNPKTKKEELYISHPGYDKYVSREFPCKEKLMKDHEVVSTRCPVCHQAAKRKIRWFVNSSKIYYSVAYCPQHGYLEGKIRIRKTEEEQYFAIKFLRLIDEKEAEEMREKRESLRCKKRKRKKSEKQIG